MNSDKPFINLSLFDVPSNNSKNDLNEFEVYTDGASRGNPGVAGIGVVIYRNKTRLVEFGARLPYLATNNTAEYCALIAATDFLIQYFKDNQIINAKVDFYADSQFMIYQLLGKYKVKHEFIKKMYQKIVLNLGLLRGFCSFHHIPREKNTKADLQANLGIDQKIPPSKELADFLENLFKESR